MSLNAIMIAHLSPPVDLHLLLFTILIRLLSLDTSISVSWENAWAHTSVKVVTAVSKYAYSFALKSDGQIAPDLVNKVRSCFLLLFSLVFWDSAFVLH